MLLPYRIMRPGVSRPIYRSLQQNVLSRPIQSNFIKPINLRATSMATYRDLGYGGGNSGSGGGNRGGWRGYGRSSPNFLKSLRYYWRTYKTPFLFSAGVVAFGHLALPYIFDYVPGMKTLKRRPDYLVYGIMAINVAGFVAWKTRRGARFMTRYGLLYKDSANFNVWGMLGSAFSHQELWHIGVNMFVLYQFGMPIARFMGSDQFLAAYMDGAVLSSLGSLLLPILIRRYTPIPSLGASGAVFTTFGIFSYLVPNAKLALFFIPLPISGWAVFLCTLAYNGAGMFMRFGGSDYAGHFAGSMVGIAWGYVLTERIRKRRERQRQQGQLGWWF